MKKYWHVIGIGIQNNLTYRFNFLARTLFGLIPLVAILYVWRTIFSGKDAGAQVSGYTLAGMISYYLLATVVDALTAVNEDDWQIAADIKDGNISQFLLKPIDYLWYRLCLFCSGRLTYVAVAFVPLTLFILYLSRYFVFPVDWMTFGLFAVSLVLTALLPKGLVRAAVFSSLIFAFCHLFNLTKGANLYDTLLQVTVAFLMGLAFTAPLAVTRNIWPLVFIHTLINFVGFLAVGGFLDTAATSRIPTLTEAGGAILFAFLSVALRTLRRRSSTLPAGAAA